jgi:hypothetical protein
MGTKKHLDDDGIKKICYYTPGENGHGIYAVPINTEAIYSLPVEKLKELRKKHQTLGIKLEKECRTEMTHIGSLNSLNNSITLDLIAEALTRHHNKDFANKTFFGVSDVSED